MTIDDLRKQIAHVTQLSNSDVDKFINLATPKTLPVNNILVQQGQSVNEFYFMYSGILRHYVVGKNNQQLTTNFLISPRFALASVSDFFMRIPSVNQCDVLIEAEVLQWTYDDLMDFADKNPKMYKFIVGNIVRSFRQKEEKEIDRNMLTAQERYEKFLIDFPNVVNYIPLQYIASYLSVRPETLSRIRARRIN